MKIYFLLSKFKYYQVIIRTIASSFHTIPTTSLQISPLSHIFQMNATIVRCAVQSDWNCSHNQFQAEVIPLILRMIANDKVPEPIILIQPTVSGKPSVPQTALVVFSGVTIIT